MIRINSNVAIELVKALSRWDRGLFGAAAMVLMCITAAPASAIDLDDMPRELTDVQIGNWLAPKAMRVAVEKVQPSIVMIETFGSVDAPPPEGRGGRRRPGSASGIAKPGEGATTGVIVSPDGYIITSTFNFLRKPPIITVVLDDGKQHLAKLVAQDHLRKLALLKIQDAEGLAVPQFVDRDELRVGQWAVSVGWGFGGEKPAIAKGVVSATSRMSGLAVQTDANISPANYGGPLIDIRGRVIGICTPMSPRSRSAAAGVEWYDSGIGFAVPLGSGGWLDALMAGNDVHPGMMGVNVQPVPKGRGVNIVNVVDGSPAGKAGVKKGDRLTHINGKEIRDLMELRAVIGGYAAGEEISVTLKNGDKSRDVKMTLAQGFEQLEKENKKPKKPKAKPEKGGDGGEPDDADGEVEGGAEEAAEEPMPDGSDEPEAPADGKDARS